MTQVALMHKLFFIVLFIFAASVLSFAQNNEAVEIHFRINSSEVDMDYMDNSTALDSVISIINNNLVNIDNTGSLEQLWFCGGSSPEGSIRFNRMLSEKRANSFFAYIDQRVHLSDSLTSVFHVGRDWKGLLSMVENDSLVPYREDVLDMLRRIVSAVETNPDYDPLNLVKKYKKGIPYSYMYKYLFPYLRSSKLYIKYKEEPIREDEYVYFLSLISPLADSVSVEDISKSAAESVQRSAVRPSDDNLVSEHTDDRVEEADSINDNISRVENKRSEVSGSKFNAYSKPFYMSLKTNMLLDAAITPNIGLEFYLGGNFSITANANFAWWKNDKSHFYWQTYGGDAEIRYWFGRAAWNKPLTGHHVGIIGQMFTYDFEFGGRGYQAPDWHWGLGAAYGYSLPITKRLNIDFSIAAGYITGVYHEYIPIDGHYVWQVTKRRHYFGPIKAEVTLVWLLGNGNHNKLLKRGGRR